MITRRLIPLALLPLLLAGRARAAPPAAGVVSINYGPDHKQALDVHTRPGLKAAPVLLYVHGGGWRAGDKRAVNALPDYAARHGLLLVSADHRAAPQVDAGGCAEDVAAAAAWALDNAARHGGDPRRVFLLGHSSGAHLVALVAVDPAYLAARGKRPDQLAGVIGLDGAGYDAVAQMATLDEDKALADMLRQAFGARAAALSPTRLVRRGRAYPPFLLFHVDRRPEAQTQSGGLAAALRGARAKVQVALAGGRNHMTLNRAFGLAGDPEGERAAGWIRSAAP